MRIHQLTIQAFGPFAGTEHIDFDELGAAGLFLLDGPTGAGKSSILDAICYAIYGALPGNRQGSRQIRSDHAAEGLAPEVACELSVGARRFEVTRSPAWMRPSKRAKSGFTEEKAKSALREYVDGEWQALSTRNDEVGQTLGAVLGLDREQFTKVVMLPQGGFADFLRAKDTEREKLLARLFDTSDYAKIEEEFAARLQQERKRTETIEAELAALENQVRSDATGALQAAGIELPGADEPDLDFDGLQEHLETLRQQRAETAKARRADQATASRRHQQLQERQRIFGRLAELRQLETAHAANDEAATAAEERLHLDAKATQISAYQRQQRDAQQNVSAARQQLESRAANFTERFPEREIQYTQQTLQSLATEANELGEQLGSIRSALPAEEQREQLARELLRQQELTGKEQEKSERAEAMIATLAKEREELQAKDLDEVAAAAGVQQAEQALEKATEQVAAVKRREELRDVKNKAQVLYDGEASRLRDRQCSLLEAQQTLLNQSAARLAAGLVEGEPCLVCGATEHPGPAVAEAGEELVDEDAVEHLREQVEAQREKTRQVEAKLHAATTRYEEAAAVAGQTTRDEAQQQVAQHQEALKEAQNVRASVAKLVAQLAKVQHESEKQAQTAAAAKLAHGVAVEKTEALGRELNQLDARLSELRGGYGSLGEKLAELSADHSVLSALHQALSKSLDATAHLEDCSQRWEEERTAVGFTDDAAQAQALLEPGVRQELEQLRATHQKRAAAIETLSASEDAIQARQLEAEGETAPDTGQLERDAAALQEAEETYEQARQAEVVAAASLQRLQEGRDRLARRISDTGPVIESYRRLKALAEVVRGGGENRLKMTLGTYVLAARLEEVTAAATERLQVMSSQRYALEHDDTARGNAKSGLGIRVHDSWTGKYRETQTLSGGETFMASLSLALGLADVISHHSGAVDMQTLFVDEGFGSLDTETLEQVMEALESLRSGGRVIGVVSHVSEMKQRITNRLTVTKARQGSTISTNAERSLLTLS